MSSHSGRAALGENPHDINQTLSLGSPTLQIPGVGAPNDFTHLHILRVLGEGVMGRVFLAMDAGSSKLFALKVFNKHDTLETDEFENSLTERDFLTETRSNLFTTDLQASFQDELGISLLLEYCAGGDLAMEISRWSGNMPIDNVIYNAAHLLQGIASLHASGIIHRDLKPENILLTAHGHIKISDFGSAVHVDSPERWIDPINMGDFGTAAYLAPEVIAGYSYNSAIDWWSLGVIIYEMIVGEHPFLPGWDYDEEANLDIEDMQESICNGEYSLPKSLDSPSRRIIRGFLRTNPERRYGAVEARNLEFFGGWDWNFVRTLKYQAPVPRAVAACDAAPDIIPTITTNCVDGGNEYSLRCRGRSTSLQGC